jgi:hypothetical protein
MNKSLVLLFLISIAMITKVEWPADEIHGSGLLQPWVYVTNSGTESAQFCIQVNIQDTTNGRWYDGPRWPTDMIAPGQERVEWPWAVQVTTDMPRGSYNEKIVLFDESCRTELDEMVAPDAFDVM